MTSKKYDASIVGLYILDVLGRPISKIPDGGNVEFIEELRLTVAGTAGGTIIDCAKLGLKTLAVGAVGNDEKADFVVSVLEKFGVDVSAFQRIEGVSTSSSLLNVRPNGERPALHLRGASDHFLPPKKILSISFLTIKSKKANLSQISIIFSFNKQVKGCMSRSDI